MLIPYERAEINRTGETWRSCEQVQGRATLLKKVHLQKSVDVWPGQEHVEISMLSERAMCAGQDNKTIGYTAPPWFPAVLLGFNCFVGIHKLNVAADPPQCPCVWPFDPKPGEL